MSKFLNALTASAVAATMLATPVAAEKLGLGRTATPDEVAAWDIDVRPDGLGLPEGSGSVMDGEELYSEKCSVCHGDFGEAVGRWPVLAGGQDSLTNERPVKTIGSYWPYLSTVWDYVHRAMPFGDAQSLTDDEVYAIVAYLMYLNDLVDDDFVLSKENFLEVPLPNEANFFMDDRADGELKEFAKAEVCMSDCKDAVEITARAAIIDVTPEDAEARKAREAKYSAEGDDAAASEEPAAEEATEEQAATEEPAAQEAAAEPALDMALVEAGEKVFKKCKACHQVGDGAKNRTGPVLNGVVGAPFAHVGDFKYSKTIREMADEGMVWTEDNLAEFLAKPRDYIKKTKMSFAGLKKEDDIAAVIEYLKSFPE
ncbi:c-type cytochrome [Marimonas lutisalis]|uniref:c-type cytochrome n=1 Tax=Marimonas lutisalis TaxID=2545756 RepID=UPI0010F9B288|nr:c-type cytochrome [Marimonas lutisalis]